MTILTANMFHSVTSTPIESYKQKELTEEEKGDKIYLNSSGQVVLGEDGNPVSIAEEKGMLYPGKEYEEILPPWMETISEPEERSWMKTTSEPEVSEFSFLDTVDIKDIGFSFDSSPKNEES